MLRKNHKRTQSKLAANSWSSIQNINNLRFWIEPENRNSLFNLISEQPDIDKIYLYANDPYKTKYKLLINETESTGLKHLNDSQAFIEHSNDMDLVYENIEECNTNKKHKILIAFDHMIWYT